MGKTKVLSLDKTCPRLTKTVRVSDPDMWYQKNEVNISLYITPPYKGSV